MKHQKRVFFISIILLILIGISGLSAQDKNAPEKKVLTLEDYERWQHIESAAISPDGNWVTYAYKPNDGDATFYVKSLKTDKVYEIAGGRGPSFSEDSQWVAYMIQKPKKEIEKLRKQKKPSPEKVELLNLKTGNKFTVENAPSFRFSKNSLQAS